MSPETSKLDDYAERLLDIMDERIEERALPEISRLLGQEVSSLDDAYDLAGDDVDLRIAIDEIFDEAAYDLAEEDMAIAAEEIAEARYARYHPDEF